jgi:hypothetical protein
MNNTLLITSAIITGSFISGIIGHKIFNSLYNNFNNQMLFNRYILEKHITNRNTFI